MDQGASQAILLAEVPNRRFSGDIEVSLKRFVADVTNWRKMLFRKSRSCRLSPNEAGTFNSCSRRIKAVYIT